MPGLLCASYGMGHSGDDTAIKYAGAGAAVFTWEQRADSEPQPCNAVPPFFGGIYGSGQY